MNKLAFRGDNRERGHSWSSAHLWRQQHSVILPTVVALLVITAISQAAQAQVFDNLSDESDGALDFTWAIDEPQPIFFDPGDDATFDPSSGRVLDADGDHIYHFTTVMIPSAVRVRFLSSNVDGPLYWLASGTIEVSGTMDLNGQRGQDEGEILNRGSRLYRLPGSGGYSGGVSALGNSNARSGNGPGGGMTGSLGGAGGGHAGAGENSAEYQCTGAPPGQGGPGYGNTFLAPLTGGSGGAGGTGRAGGGAGGGAILIASSESIAVAGTIRANGGRGGNDADSHAGGGGSGGSIRLVAPVISGSGQLEVNGGGRGSGVFVSCSCFCCGGCPPRDGRGGSGASGRIRLEAFDHAHGLPGTKATPFGIFLPDSPPPVVYVVSIAGVPVQNPGADFEMPDVEIDTDQPVEFVVEASNIPNNATIELVVISEDQDDQIVSDVAFEGPSDPLTARVALTLPAGFSRGFVRAVWDVSPP